MSAQQQKQWVPLESNPEVLNGFLHTLGAPESVSFADVYSVDLLEFVPRPALALVLLFPITAHTERVERNVVPSEQVPDVYFCKQTIGTLVDAQA